MRWFLIALLGMLVVVGVACAARRHPVQRTPASWKPPLPFRKCLVEEQVKWTAGNLKGRTTVTLFCEDGLRLIEKKTGAVLEFVSWEDVYRGT